ncbi:MAG: sigma-54 dependent transcriptional regulator [Syntrophales bacterium]|jgi:two-component system response regulator FlrC|nr:sigma-54 dependent transcriptional regulator [Syntrophales bacterium]
MIDKGRRILIVDDDPSMRLALSETLESCGYEVESADNGSEALKKFQGRPFEVVVTDMRMPRMGGMEVLKGVKKISPRTPVILITAYGTVSTAVEAMKEGASEFIMKPFSLDDLQGVVKNVLANSPARMNEAASPDISGSSRMDIITQAANMTSLLALMRSIAKSKSSVLIQGESGTGKELFARYIHRHSTRKNRPFIAVNCAAIPHHLLESEMFGHEKGAFTGAVQRKPGRFELAHGGTLLLDEIGDMDIQLQAKLLRVLQEGEVDRLGGREPTPIDVRIIATTNADLKKRIEEKKFREDLFYRLNVIPVHIPPLRERKGDVALLSEYFLKKYGGINEKKKPVLSAGAMQILDAHPWSGNVRELEHVIERSVLICDDEIILPEHLYMDGPIGPAPTEAGTGAEAVPELDVRTCPSGPVTLKEMEKSMIFAALNRVNGNRTKAARILGISVRTMRNKLQEYGGEGIASPCDP